MSRVTPRFPVRVYYEDTDASGVAYHANYLRWFERARTEWLRALGLGQEQLRDEAGVVFTVASLEIAYRRPARLDDLLEIETGVDRVRRASLQFTQKLLHASSGNVLADAGVRIGCVGFDGFRPVALPEQLLKILGEKVLQTNDNG